MNLNLKDAMMCYTIDKVPEQHSLRDVWNCNFYSEVQQIAQMAYSYHYIAMDTEFPGLVTQQESQNSNIFIYKRLKENVNQSRIIQLGITFCNDDGSLAQNCPTWQFNFKFDIKSDKYNDNSIELLKKAGVKFDLLSTQGIDPLEFAEVMTMSGLVMNSNLIWISFHSGYDFGYLLRMFSNADLPETKEEFYESLHLYFPKLYDIRHMISEFDDYKCGLNRLAEKCNITRESLMYQAGTDSFITRTGLLHQAGSDSIITAKIFFKVRQELFNDNIDDHYAGILHGILPIQAKAGRQESNSTSSLLSPSSISHHEESNDGSGSLGK